MRRSIVLVCLVFVAPSLAAAQPSAATTVQLSMDDVIEPLVSAGEAVDASPGLTSARARLALEVLSPTSPLVARAEVLLAQSGADAMVHDPEAILAPLVEAARHDMRDGRPVLAVARLDFVLARITPTSPIAGRVHALRTAAADLFARQSVIEARAPAAALTAAPVASARSGARELDVAAAPDAAAPDAAAPDAAAPDVSATPADPLRRGEGEIIELYTTAMIYGLYAGFWVPFGAGLQGGSGNNPESLVYGLSLLAGGGLTALAITGLDQGEGMRTGIGPAISVGLRYGIGTGFLMWGALDHEFHATRLGVCDAVRTFTCDENRAGWTERTAMPAVFGLSGALIGAAVGYGLRPTTGQVRFVEAGGLWGAALGLLGVVGGARDPQQGFAITAGGLGVGLLSTAIMASLGASPSAGRAGVMTLGLALGGLAGTIVPLIALAATGTFSMPMFSAVTTATAGGGLILSYLVSAGMDRPARPGTRAAAGPDIHMSAAPAEGGGTVAVAGSF